MNVYHTLICLFFLSALWDTDLIDAQDPICTGSEGGNITVTCSFTLSGSTKSFCKEEWKDGDILIKTEKDTAQSGRYSIEYRKGAFDESALLYVSIRNLTKSDSGRYRCSMEGSWSPDFQFEIQVKDAPSSSDPNWILPPVTAFVPSASTLTTTQSLSSRSGSSTPSSASPEGTKQPQQPHTTPAAGVVFYVRLTLVVMFIVLSTAVVIFYRKRARKIKEAPVETEYVNVTETNRVSEEIREEDRQSRSPPVEMSTIYSYAKYVKPNGVETSDEYSLVTAATPQKNTEDDSSKLTYSEVDFSEGASPHSAPRGNTDNVIYSVPRVDVSSDSRHSKDASPPLYSTVTSH